MRTTVRAPILVLSLLILAAAIACAPPPASREENTNVAAGTSPSDVDHAGAQQSTQESPAVASPALTGSIEIASVPPGATIMLMPFEEGVPGPPKPRGSTPTTLSGIPPGKYTVHLERVGYTYFQKTIVVKPNAVTKVTATLKKD